MTTPTPEQMRALADSRDEVAATWPEYTNMAAKFREDAATLRAAADEVDRLRVALVEARAACDRYSQALSEHREQSVLNEGRLRADIGNAPHDATCLTRCAHADDRVCSCWKRDAL